MILMGYDKNSFLAGVAAGRNMESWPAFETDGDYGMFAVTLDVGLDGSELIGYYGIDTGQSYLLGVNGENVRYPCWRETGPHPFMIDWGDGTSEYHDDLSYVYAMTHRYASAGRYTVVYYGYLTGVIFDPHWLGKSQFVGFDTPMPIPVDIHISGFEDFTALEYLNPGTFSWYAKHNDKYGLKINGSLFEETSLLTVPGTLFDGATIIGTPSIRDMFYRCKKLKTVESGLFSNEGFKNVTQAQYTFYHCDALESIPDDIFDGIDGLERFSLCFGNCTSLISAPKLWELYPNAYGGRCYESCSSLPFYDSIPNEWR